MRGQGDDSRLFSLMLAVYQATPEIMDEWTEARFAGYSQNLESVVQYQSAGIAQILVKMLPR